MESEKWECDPIQIKQFLRSPQTRLQLVLPPMDKSTQAGLLKLRQRFITEDSFGLNQFQDAVDAFFPDKSASDWKTWSAHGNALMNAYEIIVKDGKDGEWPEPPLSSDARIKPGNALDGLTDRAQGKPGRKRDFLANECVIIGTDTVRRSDGTTGEGQHNEPGTSRNGAELVEKQMMQASAETGQTNLLLMRAIPGFFMFCPAATSCDHGTIPSGYPPGAPNAIRSGANATISLLVTTNALDALCIKDSQKVVLKRVKGKELKIFIT
ncbi:hypothetical protein K438DRAFT_2097157 [Mycena galopus ATCC 62051]|nr:hypothetical protein K438DRAFT_2097157 [Mycena galopus ATCC 62051]